MFLATYGPFYANEKSLIQDYSNELNRSKLFEDKNFIQKPGEKFKLLYYPNNSDSKFASCGKAPIAFKFIVVCFVWIHQCY